MAEKVPQGLASFTILPINLPPLPSYPTPAVHYLYLRPDAPPTPTVNTPRSLFLSNIPVDASENSLRAFFKQVGGARVERVEFEGDADRESEVLVKGERWSGHKRKRNETEEFEIEGLPTTWDVKARKSGSSAVVVFVDKATAEAVLKECKRMRKKKETVEWRSTEEWGEKSMLPFDSIIRKVANVQQDIDPITTSRFHHEQPCKPVQTHI
jgi:ribosomal RNA-processing protein 7